MSIRKDNTVDVLKIVTYTNSSNAAVADKTTLIVLDSRNVPNVGVVLDGNWVSTSGTTSCLLQDYYGK